MNAMKYVLSVDQSTQGTKALLFDEKGVLLNRADLPHQQIIYDTGWVSHDPEEIYGNLLKTVQMVTEKAGIKPDEIACMGISNQRETSVAWDKNTGKPVCDAIVWQCARAVDVCKTVKETGIGDTVRERTGIPISPYFQRPNSPGFSATCRRQKHWPTSINCALAPLIHGWCTS